jgi:PncC family amidohydrolase
VSDELIVSCERLVKLLVEARRKLVLAESCTAGLVAASLGGLPGVSKVLCGSAVTYRDDTKARWLGIARDLLHDPGPVSEITARKMALGVLAITPEAHVAAATTGHLGPNAPPDLDGILYVATCHREAEPRVIRYQLNQQSRLARQQAAALCAVDQLVEGVGSRE